MNYFARFSCLSVFLFLLVLLCSCTSVAEKNEFYLGLLVSDNNAEKVRLFEKALSNKNEYVRQAAAEELAILMSNGINLSNSTMTKVRREVRGWWKDALDVTRNKPNREDALSFLFRSEQTSASFNAARLYVLRECQKRENFFSLSEYAAIHGHHAVAELRYGDAVKYFRLFQEDGEWTEQIPLLFIEYPVLINDLGRAFQYSRTESEGSALFIKWETNLKHEETGMPDLFNEQRYRLIFYAGRNTLRLSRQSALATSLFERAIPLLESSEQRDACMWYLLDLSLTESTDAFIERLEQFIPNWDRDSYFNDILERFLHQLVTRREWTKVIKTFALIQNSGAVAAKTSYSWVIARTIQDDLLSAQEKRLAASTANVESVNTSTYMNISYNMGVVFYVPTLYYRYLTADFLGRPFVEFAQTPATPENSSPSSALRFLLGFFNNGAAEFALPYIRAMEKELTPEELRIMAEALNGAGLYAQSMGLVALYINTEDYIKDRRDWELSFPRPFIELIETRAQEYELSAPLLLGLIRTESAFRSSVVSRAGAVGLMQLMPFTARDMAERLRREGIKDYFNEDNTVDSTDPSLNVHIGTYYFKHLMGRLDETILALMAYNGGPNRVNNWRRASRLPLDLFVETVPILETRDYGKRVLAAARIYEELYYRD
ncbi:MAG: lytic transglycosylase domain-containing protein [Treponema sp.]|nr:lytic transglycosylase domain-containing protein [Treponema sp.]